MTIFDVVIIGSGPGGYSAAMRAIDYKLNICLIEAKNLGGTGIINGALTSKTMYELSQDYSIAARIDRGFRASGLIVDFNEVKKTVISAAKEKQYQMLSQIETFSPEKSKNGSITIEYGWAKFKNQHTVICKSKNGLKEIQGKNFIIATGTRPRVINGLEIDGNKIITSDHILNLKKFPERMLIIGSGIIGCEFATIFSNFKQTEVHLLDRANKVLPYEDDDVSDFVSKNLEDNGVIVHHTAHLRTIRKHENHLDVVLDYSDGHSKVIEVDLALVAIGRIPNTDNLGLENIGVDLELNGTVKIKDDCMLTGKNNYSHIYAVGDITGHTQLYSVAELQGRRAIEKITDTPPYPLNYNNMSTLMFFRPEVASVGANEKQLREKGIPHKVAFYSNKLVNRAIAMRNTNGFVKIIIDEQNRILGMRAAGPQASAFIVAVAHLINQGNSLNDVLKTFHPHPSVTEGIQECLRVIKSRSIFKPEAFPDLIKVREWHPDNKKN
ncbi:MAG: NAD(P)/FAD-dependent oxidoreductase [Marinilabiliaceae bacterium]|nr:NAD(P)/FAD-dependent oxidoreductase [Marinilabiliaceae bacterium]